MTIHKTRCRPIPLPLQYIAEIIRSDGDQIRVYIDGAKRRVESTVAGRTTIVIWRPDLGAGYMIDADTYLTTQITDEMEAISSGDIEEDVEWEHVATEPFDSRTVDLFDVFDKGGASRRSRIYVDSETRIRWKEITFNKLGKEVLTIERRNVVMGPPPPSVFELPAGLRQIRRP